MLQNCFFITSCALILLMSLTQGFTLHLYTHIAFFLCLWSTKSKTWEEKERAMRQCRLFQLSTQNHQNGFLVQHLGDWITSEIILEFRSYNFILFYFIFVLPLLICVIIHFPIGILFYRYHFLHPFNISVMGIQECKRMSFSILFNTTWPIGCIVHGCYDHKFSDPSNFPLCVF